MISWQAPNENGYTVEEEEPGLSSGEQKGIDDNDEEEGNV